MVIRVLLKHCFLINNNTNIRPKYLGFSFFFFIIISEQQKINNAYHMRCIPVFVCMNCWFSVFLNKLWIGSNKLASCHWPNCKNEKLLHHWFSDATLSLKELCQKVSTHILGPLYRQTCYTERQQMTKHEKHFHG